MPLRSSRPMLRYPRPHPRRPRRWPWLIVVLLGVAIVYFTQDLWRPEVEPRIGIVAGHWQYDPGATCPDGLREIDITLPVARLVVDQLRAQDYQAEVLPEYSSRLNGYRATALVSLHADSCLPQLSGYKVVGSGEGLATSESTLLAECLTQAYAAATGLPFHANTITPAMTQYHAFGQVSRRTPAAIVELGFMGGDRSLLTARQEQVAQGIVRGVLAFLDARANQKR